MDIPGASSVIEPRKRDLGGFSVGRVLPHATRRMVGPFIFFDEMGPSSFAPGEGIDVRPHPHIGLATVTYLLEGELRHRDNLGFDQIIRPGDVNWMTAGRGVVHSERTAEEPRRAGQTMHGVQSWVALPEADEETDPAFHHHGADTLPVIDRGGARLRLIAGEAFGAASPVKTFSPIFYVAVEAQPGAAIPMPDEHADRALYGLTGRLKINGVETGPQKMIVLEQGAACEIEALEPARAMLLGGAPLGPRRIWWNLVSSSRERIEKAKSDWRAATAAPSREGLFGLPAGEEEFIPLPEE